MRALIRSERHFCMRVCKHSSDVKMFCCLPSRNLLIYWGFGNKKLMEGPYLINLQVTGS